MQGLLVSRWLELCHEGGAGRGIEPSISDHAWLALEIIENVTALKPLVEELDERDRRILQMRYGQEMTQSQIGAELGVSQMHVSRLLTRITTQLRKGLLAQE